MHPREILKKKRDGEKLKATEVREFITKYLDKDVPDYIASAFLMAIFLNGMEPDEIAELTSIYIESGLKMEFPTLSGYTLVDKHSTGGVGDKVSLILAPIVAAVGVPVPMLSGRGLGHTGGTLDKLESMPGFNTDFTAEGFISLVEKHHLAIAAQNKNLCPADGKIYALRDVTATVESIPLITASIMSKKIAEGANALILDVKVGSGAFMKSSKQAEKLAHNLIAVGNLHNVETKALLTDMSEPLGRYVGNALEALESIEFLRGDFRENRLYQIVMALAAEMLVMGNKADDFDSAIDMAGKALDSGKALKKFAEMVDAQGGDGNIINDTGQLASAKYKTEVKAPKSGYLESADTEKIGYAGVVLGAGRLELDSIIDPAVGFEIMKKLGDRIEKGDAIAIIHHNKKDIKEIKDRLLDAWIISDEKPSEKALIEGLIDKDGKKTWTKKII
ncbi:MAG: thymidine phosphorylase [Candidatus Zixiibacteriota bacterium]